MATSARLSANIELPLIPDISSVPIKIYEPLLGLYNAIRTLAGAADIFAGADFRTQANKIELAADDLRKTLRIEAYSIMYLEFAASAVYGNMISVNSAGKGILALHPTEVSGTPTRPAIGFLAQEEVAVGEIGKVALRGIIGVSGAQAGALYAVSVSTPGGIVPFTRGVTINFPVAFGLSDTLIYYLGTRLDIYN